MPISKRTLSFLIILISLSAVIFYYIIENGHVDEVDEYQSERVIRYGFSIGNSTSEMIGESEVQVFLPLAKTPYQKREKVNVNLPYKLSTDSFGNEKIIVSLPSIPPYGSAQVIVSVKVLVTSNPNYFRLWSTDKRFLREEKFIEVLHPDISNVAKSIQGNTNTDLSSALHQWVATSIHNEGYIAQNLGALYAVTNKKGDCTEYAYALTALARNRSLPAVPVAGFALTNQSAVLHPSDYHNWAYLFENDHWVFSDPMKNIYNTNAEYHLVFNVLNEESLEANSQRFYSADPRLTIRML